MTHADTVGKGHAQHIVRTWLRHCRMWHASDCVFGRWHPRRGLRIANRSGVATGLTRGACRRNQYHAPATDDRNRELQCELSAVRRRREHAAAPDRLHLPSFVRAACSRRTHGVRERMARTAVRRWRPDRTCRAWDVPSGRLCPEHEHWFAERSRHDPDSRGRVTGVMRSAGGVSLACSRPLPHQRRGRRPHADTGLGPREHQLIAVAHHAWESTRARRARGGHGDSLGLRPVPRHTSHAHRRAVGTCPFHPEHERLRAIVEHDAHSTDRVAVVHPHGRANAGAAQLGSIVLWTGGQRCGRKRRQWVPGVLSSIWNRVSLRDRNPLCGRSQQHGDLQRWRGQMLGIRMSVLVQRMEPAAAAP